MFILSRESSYDELYIEPYIEWTYPILAPISLGFILIIAGAVIAVIIPIAVLISKKFNLFILQNSIQNYR
jgi:hypothetical protein